MTWWELWIGGTLGWLTLRFIVGRLPPLRRPGVPAGQWGVCGHCGGMAPLLPDGLAMHTSWGTPWMICPYRRRTGPVVNFDAPAYRS